MTFADHGFFFAKLPILADVICEQPLKGLSLCDKGVNEIVFS